MAVGLCRGDENSLKVSLKEALEEDILESELREVILTSYLFDGYPAALEGFRILNEISITHEQSIDPVEYSGRNIELWRQRGNELCQQIYGPQFNPLMKRVSEFAPELKDSMIIEGYGKVLSRPALHIIYRELCVVSMLAFKFCLRQLRSHILGALRVGADVQQLEGAIDVASEVITEKATSKCQETLSECVARYHMSK